MPTACKLSDRREVIAQQSCVGYLSLGSSLRLSGRPELGGAA